MAAKVTLQVGPVSLRGLLSPAVDNESSDRFTVCTGEPEGSHPPARVKQHVDCTDPKCEVSHGSAYGYKLRGREVGDQVVVLTTEEIEAAKGEARTGREGKLPIQIGFHPREKVYAATVAADSVQNMFPDKGYERPYVVLREALKRRPNHVACTIWAPQSANALWVIEVVEDRLVMSKRCWPEQVRAVPAAPDPTWETREAEVDWFGQLIEITSEDFDLSVYSDQAKAGLADLIASKGSLPDTPHTITRILSGDPGIPDLLASIQEAVDAAKVAKAPAKAPARKRTPAKKTAARKAPARKVVAA